MRLAFRHLAIATGLGFSLFIKDEPLGAQSAGRALRLDDYYRIPSIGSVAMSPNGQWVAYVLTTREEATNANPGSVWLVPSDGSTEPVLVSPDRADASQPEWSDDGRLHFRAVSNWFTVDVAGPPMRIERTTTSNAAPRRDRSRLTNPLGEGFAELRDVKPAARRAESPSEFEQRHEARFKGVQFDWLNFQRDGQPFPAPNRADPFVSPPQEVFITDKSGAERQITRLGLRPTGLEWNSAGTQLLFTADSLYRDELTYGGGEVYLASLDGTVKRLTNDRDYGHSGAQFSPDGKWVVYTKQLSTDAVIRGKLNHGGPTDLVVQPALGGAERVVTQDWDYLPTSVQWSPDSKHVYFMGGVGGSTHLFRVAAAGGPVQQVTTGERRVGSLSVDKAMTRMAFTVGRIEGPSEVHVAAIDGSSERQLTHVYAALEKEIAFSKADRLQFNSKDGTPVEGWLLRPHNYRADGGPYPLIVSNHGGPHSADGYNFDFKSQYFAANGYFVLKVNFRSSTGYGEKFLWATWGAWGDRDGEDVMAGIDHAITRYPIDRSRVATIGHSYGGFMTNWLITQYPDRFAAAVPGAGIVNWVSDYGTADIARTKETEFFGTPWVEKARDIMIRQSPLTYADRVKAPTLFIHGELDQRVPYSEAEQMYVALKKNGVPAKMIQYEGMAHGITGSWNQIHRAMNELRWLDRWLKPSAMQ